MLPSTTPSSRAACFWVWIPRSDPSISLTVARTRAITAFTFIWDRASLSEIDECDFQGGRAIAGRGRRYLFKMRQGSPDYVMPFAYWTKVQ
jgi:hypothetical protein